MVCIAQGYANRDSAFFPSPSARFRLGTVRLSRSIQVTTDRNQLTTTLSSRIFAAVFALRNIRGHSRLIGVNIEGIF